MQRLKRRLCLTLLTLCFCSRYLPEAGPGLEFLAFGGGLTAASGQEALGEPIRVDNLDSPQAQLKPQLSESGFRLISHAPEKRLFQHGVGAERLQVQGPAGRVLQLLYDIPPAPVIQELRFQSQFMSNRAGVHLAARIVLPRSKNPATGQPFELLIRGNQLGQGRRWEALTLDQLPQLLARSVRVARAKHGGALDERGAYVKQLVILIPGGQGTTDLVLDRLEIYGVLSQELPSTQLASFAGVHPEDPLRALRSETLESDFLLSLPRVIEWQGESFESLKRLGFNTIGMQRLPTNSEVDELRRLDLKLVCPPPSPEQLATAGLPAEHDLVVAWDLGDLVTADDLSYLERWARELSRIDQYRGRPTLLTPHLLTLEASRVVDTLRLGRPVLGTPFTLREHAAWLAQRQRLARPGTPVWCNIETQLSNRQQSQAAAISPRGTQDPQVSYAQLVGLTSASLGMNASGYYFQSESSLATDDQQNLKRALALELANLRLQLLQPWISRAKPPSVARSSHNELSAVVLHVERSHLLIPISWSSNFRSQTLNRQQGAISFVVPDVAESSNAYLVTMGGLQRLRHKRVTGGVHIALEQLPYDAFLLLSEDPQAIAQVTRFVRRIAPRATTLRRELAQLQLTDLRKDLNELATVSTTVKQLSHVLERAQSELTFCDENIKTGSHELAYLRADACELFLEQLQSQLPALLGVDQQSGTLVSQAPLTLANQLHLHGLLARAPVSRNLLPGGGFESLSSLLESGWRHQQLPLAEITSAVRLSPEAPHSGSYCLELEARTLDAENKTSVVPSSPVWITSAPLMVQEGDLVEITGVARILEPLIGSVDGLQIIDTLGGPEMGLRIHEAPSWQPFRLIRAATGETQVSVTIALSGLGKAQVDDLAVRVLQSQ